MPSISEEKTACGLLAGQLLNVISALEIALSGLTLNADRL